MTATLANAMPRASVSTLVQLAILMLATKWQAILQQAALTATTRARQTYSRQKKIKATDSHFINAYFYLFLCLLLAPSSYPQSSLLVIDCLLNKAAYSHFYFLE